MSANMCEGGEKPDINIEMAESPAKEAHEGQGLVSGQANEELNQEDVEKIHFFEKVQMESEPTFWAKAVTKLPCCCCFFSYAIVAAIIFAMLAGDYYKFDKPYYRDYLIWDDPIIENWDKREAGIAYVEARETKTKTERFVASDEWSVSFIYENKKSDTGLFDSLSKIQAFEKEIKDFSEWPNFCWAKSVDDTACNDDFHVSGLKGFGGLQVGDSTTADTAKAALENARKNYLWNSIYGTYFEKDLPKSAEKLTYMRSVYKIGMPLKGYKNYHDKTDEQKEKVIDFLKEFDKLIEGKNTLWEAEGLKVSMYAPVFEDFAFDKAMFDDVPWVAAAFIFYFLWLILHTNSLIVGLTSLTVVILTFPVAMTIYEGVFFIKYMGGMHLVTIFIVLVVCTKNILVLFDTWFQTASLCTHIFDNKLERRMAFVLRRGTSGLFMTCATTTVVLMGNTWNPILPVRSAAIFAGILVVVNFFLVMMIIPPTLVFYDKIETKCCRKDGDDHLDGDIAKDINSLEEQYSGVDRFFGDKWNRVTSNMCAKFLLFLLFLAWTAYASWLSIDTQFKTYLEDYLPADNPYMVTKQIYEEQFQGSEKNPRVYFVWGVEELNNTDADYWDSRAFGTAIIDRSFNPLERETFSKLIDFCTDLQAQSWTVPESVDCWIQDLYEWTQQEGIAWVPSNQYAAQNYFMQWLQTTESGRIAQNLDKVGVIDGKITFMQISALSGVSMRDKISIKQSDYDKWEKFARVWQSKLPVSAKSIFQTSIDAWGWIPTQKSIQEDSINGVIIAAAFAFIVILFTSQNIVMAILCMLCIFSVIVSLLCLMKVFQWEIGMREVLYVIVILALSVDNIMHIAHDFTFAPQFTRGGKMRQAYLQKGKTVTSSTFLVLLAACFLFGAKITLFQDYAIAVVVTLAISYIISMIFFGALCHLLGPTSGCGDICGRLPGQEHEEELEMIRIKQEMQI